MFFNRFKTLSINLNVQHVNGVTNFDLALQRTKNHIFLYCKSRLLPTVSTAKKIFSYRVEKYLQSALM